MKKIFDAVCMFFKRLDKPLILLVMACSALSVVLIYSMAVNEVTDSVSERSYKIQLISVALGLCICIATTLIDYKLIAKLWFIYAPICLILVFLTFTGLGIKAEGADDTAWLDLGFISIQPSEFLKLAFIITFAFHLSKLGDNLNKITNVALLCLHGAVPIGLIVLQGDHGTALVYMIIFVFMIFYAGIGLRYIIGTILLAVPAGFIAWDYLLSDVHRNRILILFNPGTDPQGLEWQQDMGIAAMGSGQLFGKGLFGGEYSYVAVVESDFILTYIGQTLGFVGTIATVVVITLICLRLISNSRLASDPLGKFICMGTFAMIFAHSVLNIGMVLKVLPVIGVPLPFISSGGTATLSMYIAIGLVLSVYSHSDKRLKSLKL